MTRTLTWLALVLIGVLLSPCRPAAAQTSYSFSIVHQFDGLDGAMPEGMVAGRDGGVYGITKYGGLGHGVFFRIDSSGNYIMLRAFGAEAGAGPQYISAADDGNFYVTTSPAYASSGTLTSPAAVFRLDCQGDCSLIHTFNAAVEGNEAALALIDGHDGYVYGKTLAGGTYNGGTFFRLDQSGNALVLYAFSLSMFPVLNTFELGSDGLFYGLGGNAATSICFSLDRDGLFTPIKTLATAANLVPAMGVDGGNGMTYGIAAPTGIYGLGSIDAVDGSGDITDIYDFTVNDGAVLTTAPLLVGIDGALYGQTVSGGVAGQYGTVFRATTGGQVTTLYSFDSANSQGLPGGPLVQTPDGTLFGDSDVVGDSAGDYIYTIAPGTPQPSSSAVIDSISPSAVVVDAGPFTITLTGSGFPSQPLVDIGDATLPATVNADGSVSAYVSTSYSSSSPLIAVRIVDATTGLASPAIALEIENPTPYISSVSPQSVALGTAPVLLTVSGTGLDSGATVELTFPNSLTAYLNPIYNSNDTLIVQLPGSLGRYFAGEGQATVVVFYAALGIHSNAVPISVHIPYQILPARFSMVSFPGSYPTTAVDDLFGYSGTMLATWNSSSAAYSTITSGAPGTLQPGAAYWARFPQEVDLTTASTPVSTTYPFIVSLAQGWNMIGDPFETAETADHLFVVTDGLTKYSLSDAAAAGILGPTLWAYNTSTSLYYAANALIPYEGIWLYAYQPCELLIVPEPTP